MRDWKRSPDFKVWRKYYDNEFDRWHLVYGSSGSAISDEQRRLGNENGLPLPPPRLTGIRVPVRRKGSDSTSMAVDYTHLVHVGEFFGDHSTGMLPGNIASRRSGCPPGPLSFASGFMETRPPGLGWGARGKADGCSSKPDFSGITDVNYLTIHARYTYPQDQQCVSISHPSVNVTPIFDLTVAELKAAWEKARAARLAHAEEQQSRAFDREWEILEERMARGLGPLSNDTEIWEACAEAAASRRELTREAKVAMLRRRDEQMLADSSSACCRPRARRICDMHGNE